MRSDKQKTMKIQQIRNATLKIQYGSFTILLDPWLQDKNAGPSFLAVKPERNGVRSPLDDLPLLPTEILSDVDFCLVTHIHPDHFTADYLPQNIPVLVQNDADKKLVADMGFRNVTAFTTPEIRMGNIVITKVPARHGDTPEAMVRMGESSGYVLQSEGKTLYLAGDTVYFDGVEQVIETFRPDVIVLNCCEATIPIGRLVMGLADVEAVCRKAPNAAIIATHLDSVNHALLSSDDVRVFAARKHLTQIHVPANGEWIMLS